MPSYMLQVSYTPEAWEAMCEIPAQCMPQKTIRPVLEALAKLGTLQVKFEKGWGTMGDYDAVAIVTAKDHVQASAVAFALLGRARLQLRGQPVRTFKSVKTTPLLDPDQNETEEAFELAGQYKPS